jgi:hypothetical protein
MKRSFIVCVVALAGLLATGSAMAQGFKPGILEPETEGGILIGPVGGLNLVSYATDKFPILSNEPGCFEAQNGTGAAPFAGLSVVVPLGNGMQNFVTVEAIYDSKSSKFTSENASRTDVPTKVGGQIGPGNVETKVTADLNYMLINLGYIYNFVEGPAPVGPNVQVTFSTGINMTTTLNKTVTVSAVTGSQTVTEAVDVPADEKESLRFALRAQFGYDIPLSSNWIATPHAGYDLGLTKADKTAKNWKASSAYAGVYVRYLLQ